MTRRLILDDDPDRHAAFEKRYAGDQRTHVYNVAEFELAVEIGRYDVVHLNHDDDLDTRLAAGWLARANWTPDTIYIHYGPPAVYRLLREHGFTDVRVEPFSFDG